MLSAPSPAGRLRGLIAALAVTLLCALSASSAYAAWPGANGELLVSGFTGTADPSASVFAVDADSGALVKRIAPPGDSWAYANGALDVFPGGEQILQLHATMNAAYPHGQKLYPSVRDFAAGPWSPHVPSFVGLSYGAPARSIVLRDRRILYPALNGAGPQLDAANADGTGRRTVHTLPGPGYPESLAASPTADLAYYEASDNAERQTYSLRQVNTITGVGTTLFTLPQETGGFSLLDVNVTDVSPDGRYALLMLRESAPGTPYRNRLVAYELATGDQTTLHSVTQTPMSFPKFSPDGTKLAYVVQNVFQGPPTGVRVVELSRTAGGDIGPATSDRLVPNTGPDAINRPFLLVWRPVGAVIFDVTPTSNDPAMFGFRNRSKNPDGDAMTPVSWDFGDGTVTESMADAINHTYEKPGEYNATLTVRDPDTLQTLTGTKKVIVKAPTLSVGIDWDEDVETEGRLPVGKPFDAQVVVRASSDGVGALSELEFDEETLLRWAPAELLDIVVAEGDEDPAPFSVQPGKSRKFDVEITALEPGRVTMFTGLTGVDAAGEEVEAETSEPVRLGFEFEVTAEQKLLDKPLDAGGVEIAMPPTRIDLEFDEETGKPVPQDMTLALEVKNISGETAKEITIDAKALNRGKPTVHPLKVLRYKIGTDPPVTVSPPSDQLGDLVIPGTLANNKSVPIKFWLRASDAGLVTVQNIIRAKTNTEPAQPLSGFAENIVRIGQDVLLYVEGQELVAAQRAGDRWTLSGSVENVSTDTAVELAVLTQRSGNVVGPPVDDTLSPTGNPLGIRIRLAPGERLLLGGNFTSEKEGAPTGKVELKLIAEVPDTSEGALPGATRPVTEDEMAAGKQRSAGQGEYPATERRLSVDVSDPLPNAVSWTGYDVGWVFGDGLGRGFGKWVDSLPDRYRRSGPQFAGLNAYYWYLIKTTFKYAKPEEARALRDELVGYYQQFSDLTDGDAEDAVDTAIQTKVTEVTDAWETGDLPYFAAATGNLLGENGVDLALEGALGRAIAMRGMVRNGKVVTGRLDETRRATREARILAKGRKGYEPGDAIWLDEALRHYGQDVELDTEMLRYAKRKGLIIAMRDRSPGSIQRLAEGLLGKIEKVKSKNVSQLDVDYLGFHPSHLDTAMYKRMPRWSEVQARLPAGASDELVAKVKARWYERSVEYWKEKPLMEAYAKQGTIPVPGKKYGLNPLDNGIKVKKDEVWEPRSFVTQKAGTGDLAATTDGYEAFQPRVWGKTVAGEKHHALTGDMDLIAILDRKGNLLSKRKRLEVYKDLARLGFQHPESLTWSNIVGRLKYLWDYDMDNPNGETLLAYMFDGTRRAVKLDAAKSMYDNPVLNFMFLHGFAPDPEAPEPDLPDTPDLPDEVPAPPGADDPVVPNDYLGPSGDEGANFKATPGMPLIRRMPNGSYEQWTPQGGWQPYVPPAGGPIEQVPQTAARVSTEPGESRIVIFEQDTMDLRGTGWFTPGMQLVINPGGANQEIITVKELGSIVATEPLKLAHRRGELIGMVPQAPGPVTDPSPAPQTPAVVEFPSVLPLPPAPPQAGGAAPKITGKLAVGGKLRCSAGAWTGATSFAYSWQQEVKKTLKPQKGKGKKRTVITYKAIKSATKPTYTLKPGDRGKRIRCLVVARGSGGETQRASAVKSVSKQLAKRR